MNVELVTRASVHCGPLLAVDVRSVKLFGMFKLIVTPVEQESLGYKQAASSQRCLQRKKLA
jgi:hypothetical protein